MRGRGRTAPRSSACLAASRGSSSWRLRSSRRRSGACRPPPPRYAVCRLLVITGSMGAGKTTVMAEASDLLTARGITHAAVDLDALSLAFRPDRSSTTDLAGANLRSVWQNYAAAGIDRLLLAAAVESADQLQQFRTILSATAVVVCRLTAPLATMQ